MYMNFNQNNEEENSNNNNEEDEIFNDFEDMIIGGDDAFNYASSSSSSIQSSSSDSMNSFLSNLVTEQNQKLVRNWNRGNWKVRGFALDKDPFMSDDDLNLNPNS